MKWFDNWFRQKCKQAWETPDEIETKGYDEPLRSGRPRARLVSSTADIKTPSINGTNFVLYPATGGNILEVRIYDEKIGENHTSLHVIPLDQDLGESIGRIITIEALKR